MTKLIDILAQIDDFDPEDVIFVKPEWSREAEAKVFRLTEDYRIPNEATSLGYKYFLEVDVVRQVLDEFKDRDCTLDERCTRVIQYATYDA